MVHYDITLSYEIAGALDLARSLRAIVHAAQRADRKLARRPWVEATHAVSSGGRGAVFAALRAVPAMRAMRRGVNLREDHPWISRIRLRGFVSWSRSSPKAP